MGLPAGLWSTRQSIETDQPTKARTVKASWERALLYVGLLVWLPAIPFALALAIANFTGCELSENDVRPCVVAGLDIGLPLTLMGLMGWLVIALLPFMALTLLAGAAWGFVRLIVAWRRSIRTRKTPKPDFAADRRRVLNANSRDD
ncbi:hypothetical protein [Methylobacterium sp. BTF04]|uniref:hypothetical protein n=1 Tax=Methylobacterium sp. BTF04 TaxID=2708300 RepID=UPI0019535BA2|nr:hypothetical protein [Methylobacterium sp. BTF04]